MPLTRTPKSYAALRFLAPVMANVRFHSLSIGARIKRSREVAMSTAKEELTKLIQDQPDDSSYDEILRELAFNIMVKRGLKDSDEGKTISNEEMERRIRSWQK